MAQSEVRRSQEGAARQSDLLTMNPGVSTHDTGCFPTVLAHALHSSNTAESVASQRTTSTSLINCTGLKKCRPTTWDGRPEASAISCTYGRTTWGERRGAEFSFPACLNHSTMDYESLSRRSRYGGDVLHHGCRRAWSTPGQVTQATTHRKLTISLSGAH